MQTGLVLDTWCSDSRKPFGIAGRHLRTVNGKQGWVRRGDMEKLEMGGWIRKPGGVWIAQKFGQTGLVQDQLDWNLGCWAAHWGLILCEASEMLIFWSYHGFWADRDPRKKGPYLTDEETRVQRFSDEPRPQSFSYLPNSSDALVLSDSCSVKKILPYKVAWFPRARAHGHTYWNLLICVKKNTTKKNIRTDINRPQDNHLRY